MFALNWIPMNVGDDQPVVEPFVECPICMMNTVDIVTFECAHQACQMCVEGMRRAGLHGCPTCRNQTALLPNVVIAIDDHQTDINNNNDESLEFIRRECVHCPQCHVPILRDGGCQIMSCTRCMCKFNWNSGLIYEVVYDNNNIIFCFILFGFVIMILLLSLAFGLLVSLAICNLFCYYYDNSLDFCKNDDGVF
jgi:hypothetical protein